MKNDDVDNDDIDDDVIKFSLTSFLTYSLSINLSLSISLYLSLSPSVSLSRSLSLSPPLSLSLFFFLSMCSFSPLFSSKSLDCISWCLDIMMSIPVNIGTYAKSFSHFHKKNHAQSITTVEYLLVYFLLFYSILYDFNGSYFENVAFF